MGYVIKTEKEARRDMIRLRLSKKLTVKEFADMLGVSRTIIAYYEDGKSIPTNKTMSMINKAFGTNWKVVSTCECGKEFFRYYKERRCKDCCKDIPYEKYRKTSNENRKKKRRLEKEQDERMKRQFNPQFRPFVSSGLSIPEVLKRAKAAGFGNRYGAYLASQYKVRGEYM